jgi:hypothetical protein
MRDLALPNRRANDVPGINELSPRPLGWRNPSTGCADHPPGPLTPIFAQRFSPQVAGSRRMRQAYS